MDAWNTNFLLGPGLFSGDMLVSGSVHIHIGQKSDLTGGDGAEPTDPYFDGWTFPFCVSNPARQGSSGFLRTLDLSLQGGPPTSHL